MYITEARKKRKSWGRKPCRHVHWELEYYLGAPTGDKVCSRCGISDYVIEHRGEEDRLGG